jgi:hypothetical protein
MGCVLAYIYSYTINSPEFRPKLRKSLDDIIWDRVVLDEFGLDTRDFSQQASSMLDQLDSFHNELFQSKPEEHRTVD